MAKAREPKVFRSMDDLPLMLTPYDLMDFLGKGQRQTYELIHSEGFPYVQDGPKIKIPKWLLIEFINEKVRGNLCNENPGSDDRRLSVTHK